jgi:prepilin-type N-terminal cleavage/methylation domain-containing protein
MATMYERKAIVIHKGITLIELAIALSIMAVLAAVLLQRFAQLQRAAHAGYLKSLHGSVWSTATLTNAALTLRKDRRDAQPCIGGGVADNQIIGAGTVCSEAGLIHTMNGYPASLPLDEAGIVSAVVSAAGLSTVRKPNEAQLKAMGYSVRVAGGVTTFARAHAHDPEQCSFTYTPPLDAKTAAAISVPVTSGC